MKAQSLDKPFSFERLGLLLRNRVLDEATIVGIGAAIAVAINLITLLLARSAVFNAQPGRTSPWEIGVCLGGLLLAGGAFKGMHDGKAGTDWILLPATGAEKYAAGLLDLAVVFPLAASALGVALSALLALVASAVGGRGAAVWLPIGLGDLRAWADYAIAVSVILAGSTCFRKAALVKTVGLFIAYCLVVLVLGSLGLWAQGFFGREPGRISVDGSFSIVRGLFSFDGARVSARGQRIASLAVDLTRYALIPAFAVFFGAAKVAEKEGRDEVQ
jgi:hypothetical protein